MYGDVSIEDQDEEHVDILERERRAVTTDSDLFRHHEQVRQILARNALALARAKKADIAFVDLGYCGYAVFNMGEHERTGIAKLANLAGKAYDFNHNIEASVTLHRMRA